MTVRTRNMDFFGEPPPAFVECGYYFLIFYAIMGDALGISVGMVGAGLLALLAAYCVWRVGLRALESYGPSVAALACGASFLAIQLFFHGESILDPNQRAMVTWMLGIVVVQSLIARKGFFHRFALVVFFIGVMTLPFLQVYASQVQFERAGLDRSVGFANPNDLAAWFGFCMVYFAVAGMEARTNWFRVLLWIVGIGCLFVMALTVSRGPLLAAAVATAIALRRLLKQGFLPVMALIIVVWVVYETGLFGRSAMFYQERMGEQTGRLTVWPFVIERIWENPLAGVGASNLETYVPLRDVPLTPHNGYLYIGLAAGIIPLALFVTYWVHVARGVLQALQLPDRSSTFLLPLFAYAFLINMQLSSPFMTPWMMVTLSAAVTVGRGMESYKLRRIERIRARPQPAGGWVKVGYLVSGLAPQRRARKS